MLHKAWNSKVEMPYCFPRSSIKFQGHTVQNITDFDPNWAFPDYRPVAAFKSLRFALLFMNCFIALDQELARFHYTTYNNADYKHLDLTEQISLAWHYKQWDAFQHANSDIPTISSGFKALINHFYKRTEICCNVYN